MLSLAEKGRLAPHPYDGGKLVLFIPGSPQSRRDVESLLDVVVCSRAPWEGTRTSQPHAVTSLGLSDLFLEKKEGGRGTYQGIMERRGDSSPWEQSSCPSLGFRAPSTLPPGASSHAD